MRTIVAAIAASVFIACAAPDPAPTPGSNHAKPTPTSTPPGLYALDIEAVALPPTVTPTPTPEPTPTPISVPAPSRAAAAGSYQESFGTSRSFADRVNAVATFLAGKPLAPHAEMLVAVADEYGLDWRLLPALAMKEQGGGVGCGFNAYGWGNGGASCYRYGSYEESSRAVADGLMNLPYYAGKTLVNKLHTYNPPSVNPNYPYQVIALMEQMGPA